MPVDLGSPRKQKEIQAEHHFWLNKTLESALLIIFSSTATPDVIMEMDADFQHDPKDVLRLIKAIEDGNDYVIALIETLLESPFFASGCFSS